MKRSLILGGVLSLLAKVAFATTIFLTAGTTWTVPADWNSQQNTIEVLGHGGVGDLQCFSSATNWGGGGAAYAKITNLTLTPGATVNIHFGLSSVTSSDGVWLGSSATVFAESGWDGSGCGGSAGAGRGGRSTASVGTTKFDGGQGDGPEFGGGSGTGSGGGAAGPHGAGGPGSGSGVGGGGDAGFGGGGGTAAPTAGGNGTEFDASHGSGGGGGASASIGGASGGNYGGGSGYGVPTTGGLIVITYTPRNRVSSGVF